MVEQVFDKGIIQYHLQEQKLYVSNSGAGIGLLLARQRIADLEAQLKLTRAIAG
jgi:hypothetical protein